MTKVRVKIPAKINLSLAVGGLGEDGFHPLVTLFQAISIFDEVTATNADPGQFSVTTTGEFGADLPVDDNNLAVRAAKLLAENYGDVPADLGVALKVRKSIPVAAGMAGGSADAAGALLACALLWDLPTDAEDLHALAQHLGSDVPFALTGGNAIGTGRGDKLARALSRGSFHWVLGISGEGLSTPSVYRRYDELVAHPPIPELDVDLLAALACGDARAMAPLLRNDLQAATLDLRPDLVDVLNAGVAAGALAGLVSGSGPTCAFLAANEDEAIKVSSELSASGLCDVVKRAVGPVPGAQVIGA